MTKADVLDSFATLEICTDYEINGKQSREIPFQLSKLKVDPVYKKFKGWNQDTSSIKTAESLPVDMISYIDYINQYIGVPVKYVSNGPGREQIIHL